MSLFKIRGCSGLGDAVYNYAVCKHFKERGKSIIVETQYPDIYSPLGIKTTRERIFDSDVNCSYVPFKADRNTNQFQDVLRAAQIAEPLPMELGEYHHASGVTAESQNQYTGSQKHWKPVCLVADLYQASGVRARANLIPDRAVFQSIVDSLGKHHFTILLGIGDPVITGCDLNLKNKTSIMDLIWLVRTCHMSVTQVGSMLPLAEAFRKPVMAVLSRNYALSGDPFLNTITPKKVQCSTKSMVVYDDLKGIAELSMQYADDHL